MATPIKPAVPASRRLLPLVAGVVAGVGALLFYRHYEAAKAPEPSPIAVAAPDTVAPKPPATPYTTRHLYSETADPRVEIAAGLAKARAENKRLIVDFGGDWCGDCQVLDIYLHQPPNLELVENNFVIVHVFIGHIDKNLEIPESYGIAIHKGVPALAVLDSRGNVIYSQKTGEFEDMRHMSVASVTDFLTKWKA